MLYALLYSYMDGILIFIMFVFLYALIRFVLICTYKVFLYAWTLYSYMHL